MLDFYIYAMDQDHGLELAGNGADREFETEQEAVAGFDAEVHGNRKLFRIRVEAVAKPDAGEIICGSQSWLTKD